MRSNIVAATNHKLDAALDHLTFVIFMHPRLGQWKSSGNPIPYDGLLSDLRRQLGFGVFDRRQSGVFPPPGRTGSDPFR